MVASEVRRVWVVQWIDFDAFDFKAEWFGGVVSQQFAAGALFVWACCADVLVALMCFPVDFKGKCQRRYPRPRHPGILVAHAWKWLP
jgi:hypothetical protein